MDLWNMNLGMKNVINAKKIATAFYILITWFTFVKTAFVGPLVIQIIKTK